LIFVIKNKIFVIKPQMSIEAVNFVRYKTELVIIEVVKINFHCE
jgi:hypothetical protein